MTKAHQQKPQDMGCYGVEIMGMSVQAWKWSMSWEMATGCRLSVTVLSKCTPRYSHKCISADGLMNIWISSCTMAEARVEGWWHWSQLADFLVADTDLVWDKGWKSAATITICLCQKRERGASILTGGPLKPAAILNWLVQSTILPGYGAVSYASLVTQKEVKVPILSSAV